VYYSAAWTDSGFLLGCSHEHETIGEANSCIPCAGGYVVAVENSVMRSLTAEEEAEFRRVHYAPRTETPIVSEGVVDDPRYAVMIRVRVGDRWTWTTWMCFETYAEAAAHAREGNKVVRFRSPEYVALLNETEAASPGVIKLRRKSVPPQCEGETLLEFVDRFLSAYGLDQQPCERHQSSPQGEDISDAKRASTDPASPFPTRIQEDTSFASESPNDSSVIETPTYFARLILSRLSKSETGKLGRMREDDIAALLKALKNQFCTFTKSNNRCC
jgi:hypothetical protein